jgi:hypothetical protein
MPWLSLRRDPHSGQTMSPFVLPFVLPFAMVCRLEQIEAELIVGL